VGHLPIYGAMATLLVWENNTRGIGRWLEGMREGVLGVQGARAENVQGSEARAGSD